MQKEAEDRGGCSIKILKGFPPVALDITDGSASLSSFGFYERDTVLIDELAENFLQPKFNNLDITVIKLL